MRLNILSALALCALSAVVLAGCETTPVQQGAVIGGALGAGAGAIIGNQSHHAGTGALIGGAAGALTGALVGDQIDEARTKGAMPRPAPAPAPTVIQRGHYENRIVRTHSGETYEERVWVPDR